MVVDIQCKVVAVVRVGLFTILTMRLQRVLLTILLLAREALVEAMILTDQMALIPYGM